MKNKFINIKNNVNSIINKGSKRSVLAKKNVIASIAIKGLDNGIGFLLVPIVLNYLDQTRYGIWLTMTSIVAWFSYLDVGLGQGLRNKFAEAIALGDNEKARKYVSTTYAILAIISITFCALLLLLNNFLPWSKFLNVQDKFNNELSGLALIVFGFFFLQLTLKLITIIIVADQKPAIKDAILLIGKILILVTIYIFTKTIPGSLIYLGLAYSGIPVFILVIVSFYFFSNEYKKYRPSIHFIKFEYLKDLMGLGWKFFIIQIALVIIMSTDNIIISQLYSPSLVTPYQIANKYFSLVLIGFTIIISPMWSASSEALVKKDYKWIKSSVRKLQWVAIIFSFFSLFMFAISKYIYSFWVGDKVEISYLLSFFWMLFVIIGMFNGIYLSVINSSGSIKLQMGVYIFAMIINIPLSIYFASNLHLGIEGVILATVVCQSLHLVYGPYQYKKLISKY